jgi:hypothetical protein
MISVSDHQLRIVADAAEGLPAEARGTFLRRVVAEVREGRSFKDSDIERAVRVALFDQTTKQASVSSTDQGRGKQRSDTPTVSEEALASHPFAAFLRRIAGLLLGVFAESSGRIWGMKAQESCAFLSDFGFQRGLRFGIRDG